MKNKEEVIKQDSIYVRDSNTGCTYSLKYEDIVYITIEDYLIKYHSVDYGDLYVASGTLNGCCNLLPGFFCRLHRNLVVNMNFMKIFSAQEKYVLLSGFMSGCFYNGHGRTGQGIWWLLFFSRKFIEIYFDYEV